MKVAVQVIDTFSGMYQHGVIDELAVPSQVLDNALSHFGILKGEYTLDKVSGEGEITRYTGTVDGTTKVFSAIAYEVQKTS